MCLLMTEEIKTSPASEQGIPQNSTVQKTDASMASTQQLSGNYFIIFTSKSTFFRCALFKLSCTEIIKLHR
jgi:hypothetical protein